MVRAAELFDPLASSFVAAGELTRPRTGHTATLLPDGRVLVLGGTSVTPIESFDPVTATFTVVGDTGVPRTGHTTTVLSDGRVLIAGGRFITTALDDLLVYDPATSSLLSLSDATVPAVTTDVVAAGRIRADILAEHGPPEAFAIFYFDEFAPDGSVKAASVEQWSYYSDGVEYTFADDDLVAEDALELEADVVTEPVPYEPDQFRAYMNLEEVVAAAGVEEYLGGPADEIVEGGELYFADRLMWSMKDGELRSIEALALEVEAVDEANE
jgi:hypothetical protein